MCPDCFLEETFSFESEKSFDDFMGILSSKKKIVRAGEMPDDYGKPVFSFLGFRLYGSKTKRGYSIFHCQTCGQKWKLSEPDYAWRGFFTRLDDSSTAT